MQICRSISQHFRLLFLCFSFSLTHSLSFPRSLSLSLSYLSLALSVALWLYLLLSVRIALSISVCCLSVSSRKPQHMKKMQDDKPPPNTLYQSLGQSYNFTFLAETNSPRPHFSTQTFDLNRHVTKYRLKTNRTISPRLSFNQPRPRVSLYVYQSLLVSFIIR